jgi:hypothetical protein
MAILSDVAVIARNDQSPGHVLDNSRWQIPGARHYCMDRRLIKSDCGPVAQIFALGRFNALGHHGKCGSHRFDLDRVSVQLAKPEFLMAHWP